MAGFCAGEGHATSGTLSAAGGWRGVTFRVTVTDLMGHTAPPGSPAAPAPAPDSGTPRLIAREMAAGFGVVSLVAVAMCGLLLALINQVSGLVMGMREEESAIRQGFELATAVREQHLHLVYLLLEGDRSHLGHYGEWRSRVRAGLQRLSPHVPEEERWRISALEKKIEELDGRISAFAFPALEGADRTLLIAENRAIASLAQEASTQADALARAVESRMAHSHLLATRATRLGLVGGGLGALVVVALSAGFTVHLRRAVLRPLAVLTGAARRFGAGEFGARVGAVGRGELLALSQAFDRMAEELAERQRRLVHNERMAAIGHLAAGVAHELNNPIGIIRGYLRTMGAKDDPKTLEEELQILDEEAAHCQRIAEDLLAYARPLELRLEPIRTRGFLEEVLRRFGESPDARGARLEVHAEDFELFADRTRLRQVVINLVQNAVQVSPEGAGVTVSGRAEAGHYLLEVADHGPGVPVEEQGRIFEPFYSRRRGGSGLGLSVCLGIVRAHGGTVTVDSREGAGAVFRVRLPARPPATPGADAGEPS